jgi:hypothetical protein
MVVNSTTSANFGFNNVDLSSLKVDSEKVWYVYLLHVEQQYWLFSF